MTDPILVTGCPRSGTTWIGKMINLAKHTGYIHEAYNVLVQKILPGEERPNQFCLIDDSNEAELATQFDKIMKLQYSFRDQLEHNHSISNFVNSFITHFKFRRYRNENYTPLLKDPFVIFSVEWFEKRYNTRPVILTRHPGAIYDSFSRLDWNIDMERIQSLLDQDSVAHQIIDESQIIEETNPSMAKQVGILWTAIQEQIAAYQRDHEDWLFIRYEDIFLNLESYFKKIFQYLELDLDDDMLSKIYFYTSRGYFPKEKSDVDTRLERQDLLSGWKQRLDQSIIEELQANLGDIYYDYYRKENWSSDIQY